MADALKQKVLSVSKGAIFKTEIVQGKVFGEERQYGRTVRKVRFEMDCGHSLLMPWGLRKRKTWGCWKCEEESRES